MKIETTEQDMIGFIVAVAIMCAAVALSYGCKQCNNPTKTTVVITQEAK